MFFIENHPGFSINTQKNYPPRWFSNDSVLSCHHVNICTTVSAILTFSWNKKPIILWPFGLNQCSAFDNKLLIFPTGSTLSKSRSGKHLWFLNDTEDKLSKTIQYSFMYSFLLNKICSFWVDYIINVHLIYTSYGSI